MTDFTEGNLRVPEELSQFIDEKFMHVHEKWSGADFEKVVSSVPKLETIDIGNENIRLARMMPMGEIDDNKIVMAYPYQQKLGRTMLMRSAFLQQSVFPNSELILLPQVYNGRNQSFGLNNDDKAKLAGGSLRPVAEKYVRAFEEMDLDAIALAGYSLGGRLVLDIAGVNSDFEVTGVNADEAPLKPGRTAKQLQKDFMSSGTFGQQRKSMSESGFGALMREYAGARLGVDYAMFGAKTLGANAKLMHQAMAGGSVGQSVHDARRAYENDVLPVKIGHVEGSKLTDVSDLERALDSMRPGVTVVKYTGEAANAHATGDNYAAHALMVKHGLGHLHRA